jgi:hypothetical protein
MQHNGGLNHKNAGSDGPRLSMMDAIVQAKTAVATMTVLQFDQIARCERQQDGTWIIVIDVVESMARMGDNDLLASYEVRIDPDGEPVNVARTRRYHREDRDQS